MSKLQIPLLVALSLIFFAGESIAQKKPLACQVEKAAGLEWENGRWVTKTFIQDKFILVQTKDGLTTDSAAKALQNDYSDQISCIKGLRSTCFDGSGSFLYFDHERLKGGISHVFGSISLNGTVKDSVTVEVFSCTPF